MTESTYDQASRGHHPDLHHAGITDPNLARTLHLCDVFTPLCTDFAGKVRETETSRFKEVQRGFKAHTDIKTYLDEEERKRLLLLDKYFYKDPADLKAYVEDSRSLWDTLEDFDKEDVEEKERYLLLRKQADDLGEFIDVRPFPDPNQEVIREGTYAKLQEQVDLNTNKAKLEHGGGFASLDHVSGKFSTYVWASTETQTGDYDKTAAFIVAPVGEYGEEHSCKLVTATKIMVQLAEEMVIEKAQEIVAQHQELIDKATTRGTNFSLKVANRIGLAALQEGIVSIAGSISLLTANKVEGFSADDLVNSIVSANLPSQMSRRFPPGYIMPKVLAGKFFENPLVEKNGKVRLSDDFLENATVTKSAYVEHVHAEEGHLPDNMSHAATGDGCPVGYTGPEIAESGITVLSKAFLEIYNSLD